MVEKETAWLGTHKKKLENNQGTPGVQPLVGRTATTRSAEVKASLYVVAGCPGSPEPTLAE